MRSARLRPLLAWALGLALSFGASGASGQAAAPALVDRVVVRFTAPETGGVEQPRFIFERQLAFETRLEALADVNNRASVEAYPDRHVRAALERHMAETLLASLEITPEPTPHEFQLRQIAARQSLIQQIGQEQLDQACAIEGISPGELAELLARRARASLYLDRMVATMLTPSDTELRIVHRTTRTPFSDRPYEDISAALSRWYVAQRLNVAVRAFYEGARSRIQVSQPSARAPEP